MYVSLKDSPLLSRDFACYFESKKSSYIAEETALTALKILLAAGWTKAVQLEINNIMERGKLEASKLSEIVSSSSMIKSTILFVRKPEELKARMFA